ncbi:fluoride efflux transporter FluC [Levilactobacillus tujiorum]|uniref:fluoride efflux transporter FluC n=1 Tax=Levilactobacillus tujiorum TaxID=2912243 RepID=UPI001456BB52|nr:CrcB family protein [Levilactobacillus tujiorum]
MFKKISYIFVFAFCGSLLRLGLTAMTSHHLTTILLINVAGSFLLAFISKSLPTLIPLSEAAMAGLTVGLVGSFTTFSTFSMDVVHLLQQGAMGLALTYWLASLLLGCGAAVLGFRSSARVTEGA